MSLFRENLWGIPHTEQDEAELLASYRKLSIEKVATELQDRQNEWFRRKKQHRGLRPDKYQGNHPQEKGMRVIEAEIRLLRIVLDDKSRASDGKQAQASSVKGGADSQARQRAAFVMPILVTKGWSIFEWATDAKVDFHTANDYLKGTKNSYNSTRTKLAASLGVKVEDLPR